MTRIYLNNWNTRQHAMATAFTLQKGVNVLSIRQTVSNSLFTSDEKVLNRIYVDSISQLYYPTTLNTDLRLVRFIHPIGSYIGFLVHKNSIDLHY